MPYYLDNAFLLDDPWITVVGCGGTGGFVAEGLCRLFQGRKATIVLVDHDRVEPHNLLRQNFLRGGCREGSRARRWPTGWRKRTGVPWATPSTPFREERRLAPMGTLLPRPARPTANSLHHRLRRQRRRTAGRWRSPCREIRATVAHRRGQRHQLGPGAGIGNVAERGDPGTNRPSPGETCHLAARAHAPAPRPADGGIDHDRPTWTAPPPSTSPTRTRPSTR